MPDPLCHATQGGLMMVAPFLRFIRHKSTLIALAVVGAILGDLPDIIGVFGEFILKDDQKLYWSAHTGSIAGVLHYIPMYWLHIFLDTFTHTMEDRWSVWNEWVGFEAVAWTLNILVITWFVRIWKKKRDERRHALVMNLSAGERRAPSGETAE